MSVCKLCICRYQYEIKTCIKKNKTNKKKITKKKTKNLFKQIK